MSFMLTELSYARFVKRKLCTRYARNAVWANEIGKEDAPSRRSASHFTPHFTDQHLDSTTRTLHILSSHSYRRLPSKGSLSFDFAVDGALLREFII